MSKTLFRTPVTYLIFLFGSFAFTIGQPQQAIHSEITSTDAAYVVDGGRIAAWNAERSTRISVTGTLPFEVADGAPVLVLPHARPARAMSMAGSIGLDATIVVSVSGGIYTSPDGGARWIRTLTTSDMYTATQFRIVPGSYAGKSIYLDVHRNSDATTHSWLSRNGGMSWYKVPDSPNNIPEFGTLKGEDLRKTQALPFDITWGEPIMLSDTGWSSYGPKIALTGEDTVHVTWWGKENRPYCRSLDDGATFSLEREIFPGDTISGSAEIIARDSDVYIFFANGLGGVVGKHELHMLKSGNCGESWTQRTRIGLEASGEVTQTSHCGDSLIVLYPSNSALPRNDAWRLLVSTDNGNVWTKRSSPLNEVSRISLAAHGLHMITNGYQYAHTDAIEAMYARSTDLGVSWIDTTLLSINDGWFSDLPVIASFTASSHIEQAWSVWRDVKYGYAGAGGIGAGLAGRFQLPGNQWTEEALYTSSEEPIGSEPRLAANTSVRAMTCFLDYGDQWHAGVTWTDNGITEFNPMFDLTPGLEISSPPALAISEDAIHVVWEQADRIKDRYHIYYRKGTIHHQRAGGTAQLPSVVKMDSTGIYTTGTRTVTARYSSVDTLLIASIVSDNPLFVVTPARGMILPGEDSLCIAVNYRSTVASVDSSHLYLYHNGSGSPQVVTVIGRTGWDKVIAPYLKGRWNLVSVSLAPLHPIHLPQMFGFAPGVGYYGADSMKPSVGYWAKPDTDLLLYEGVSYAHNASGTADTVELKKGWNMIGIARLDSVSVASLRTKPEGVINGSWYGYDGERYFSPAFLVPGYGYFIKAKADGKLIVPAITSEN